jgi:glycosyltransferase involved in cell wall biosynthesis
MIGKVLADGFVFENTHQKGIRRYMDELMRRVECPFSLFLENPAVGSIPNDWSIVGPLGASPGSPMNLVGRWKYRERAKNWRKEIQSHSVFHTSYFRQCPVPGIPSVVVVHDMVYELMPNMFCGDAGVVAAHKKGALDQAKAIVAISESTKSDLLSIYPEFSDKIHVVRHGADHLAQKDLYLDEGMPTKNDLHPYALFVGHRSGYKNFQNLLDALQTKSWPSGLKLKVIGPPFDQAEILNLRARGVTTIVEYLKCLTDRELSIAYEKASVFIFPSFFEGFGFPLIEAQARGVPVVASNIKVFHEVGGGAFVKFDPKSPESLALGVAQALENPLREKLIQCGRENVKRFTWAETARKTQEIWHACTKP